MEKVQFDDIAGLQKFISEDFGAWGNTYEVTQEKVNQFAELTGDHQWIHVDVERCKKESPFGGPIAHGFLTLSLLPFLSAGGDPEFAIVGQGNAVNYGADSLRFVMPVPVGASVHARSRLKAVEAVKKGTRVVQETMVHVVGQEKPAIIYEMITLYQAPR